MRDPVARPTRSAARTAEPETVRDPRAFAATAITPAEDVFETADDPLAAAEVAPAPDRARPLWRRLVFGAGAVLVSLGLGLMAERLISDLFARYAALGWVGLAALTVLVVGIVGLAAREVMALRRLRRLDHLRRSAAEALEADDAKAARAILDQLQGVYAGRPDLARRREGLAADASGMLDGAEIVKTTERALMLPLDARARALTAASARRVALVTAVSPRAVIDITFVIFESVRLARTIAQLYGARPGFFGFFRLIGAILTHLAVTGGLVLADGVAEQLIGQGLAARLSARLGEGVVNGLMTVRVGIAAIRVVRPLPFAVAKPPVVVDFMADLTRTVREETKP